MEVIVMPRPDGTLYPWERAELNNARARYDRAVDKLKRHPESKPIYEALEKEAFADLMIVNARYAGCR